MSRSSDPDITNLLNLAAHTEFAARTGDQSGDTVHRKRKKRGNSKDSQAQSDSATRTLMHEIAYQQSCRRTKNDRSRKSTALDPYRSITVMFVNHKAASLTIPSPADNCGIQMER